MEVSFVLESFVGLGGIFWSFIGVNGGEVIVVFVFLIFIRMFSFLFRKVFFLEGIKDGRYLVVLLFRL